MCQLCRDFYARFRCNKPNECDCPRCQGMCDDADGPKYLSSLHFDDHKEDTYKRHVALGHTKPTAES